MIGIFGEKAERALLKATSSSNFEGTIGKNIAKSFRRILYKIEYFFKSPWSIIFLVILLVLFVALYVTGAVISTNHFGDDSVYCVNELQLETSDMSNKVLAEPGIGGYLVDNTYKYEQTTQKSNYSDFGLSYNGQDIKINILNSWIPWFGDQYIDKVVTYDGRNKFSIKSVDDNNKATKEKYINFDTPNPHFICNMTRSNAVDHSGNFVYKSIKSGEDKFKVMENEFYYIKNYYEDVFFKNGANDETTIELKILDPNEQQQCWINRGMGLYMGFFGKNGKIQPNHFHHLAAQKLVCEASFFIPESHITLYGILSVNPDFKLIKNPEYKVSDFINEYFTASNYLIRDKIYNSTNTTINSTLRENIKAGNNDVKNLIEKENTIPVSENCRYGNAILCIKKNEVVYNIRLHEDLLYEYGVKDPGMVIANSISMFKKACYEDKIVETTDNEGNEITEVTRYFNSKFRFEENSNSKIYSDYNNKLTYDIGEVIKFVILDKYYKDNQGYYKLEFLSGFNIKDNINGITNFLIDIERFLLGTSAVGTSEDRRDGMMFKIYKSIVTDSIRNLLRAILSLFIIVNGFMLILGYKKFKIKDFMMFCFKMTVVFLFISGETWLFFNRLFIDFFVNGTSGMVNLVFDIFSKTFISYNPTNNILFDYVSLESVGSSYLSYNFRFLDNIFQFLFSETLHLKLFALLYEFPIIGLVPFLFIYYLLIKYILILFGTAIPFLKNLLQITILLGLAPLFLLFIFFETTNGFFKNWLNYLISRMFELIVFFFVLFFACGLVNNRFLDLLRYEVCKENLAEELKKSWGIIEDY